MPSLFLAYCILFLVKERLICYCVGLLSVARSVQRLLVSQMCGCELTGTKHVVCFHRSLRLAGPLWEAESVVLFWAWQWLPHTCTLPLPKASPDKVPWPPCRDWHSLRAGRLFPQPQNTLSQAQKRGGSGLSAAPGQAGRPGVARLWKGTSSALSPSFAAVLGFRTCESCLKVGNAVLMRLAFWGPHLPSLAWGTHLGSVCLRMELG